MPCVHQLANCKIVIYADDHNPPHFHVKGAGWSYVVDIRTLSVTRGNKPAGNGDSGALDWATENVEYLLEMWEKYNERD